jgi:D-glycero-D-manno-heptose 1,7-bisphosphate phosphatase
MAGGMRSGVLLDRDGVLNRTVMRDGMGYPPSSVEDMALLDGVAEACGILAAAGCVLAIVTNQPDLARGKASFADVAAINARLRELLALDAVYVCPHDDGDACACRKPKPGLLLEAARVHRLDLGRSVMVGDRWRDIEAGVAAGCRTVFIDHSYRERRPVAPNFVCGSLLEAVPFILSVTGAGAATKGIST